MCQVKRSNPWSSGGVDGWLPAELRLLPISAWEDRLPADTLFEIQGAFPEAYLTVPMAMLRNGDGITPLDHRAISVHTAN